MPARRKILFLIESLSGGGAEKVQATLVKHLDRSKFSVTLCCLTNVGKYTEDVRPYVNYKYVLPDPSSLSGLRLFYYKIKYWLIYKCLSPRWVYRLFIPKGNDVEIAFVEGDTTRILSGSSNKKARKIAWVHTDMRRFHNEDDAGEYYISQTRTYNLFDQIVAVSESVRKSFLDEFPLVKSDVQTIYNPVDRNEIIDLAGQNMDVPDRVAGRFRLISVGRLVPVKAFDRLLRVARELLEKGYPLELWIIGSGNQREKLQNFIAVSSMEEFVRLWGFQTNPYKFLSKSDLFVCSSIAEGFSTAATEAIVLGLPVVTTDCSGMDELLDGESCGIITGNDESSLMSGIMRVLDDKELYAALRTSSEERGRDFTISIQMANVERLLCGD